MASPIAALIKIAPTVGMLRTIQPDDYSVLYLMRPWLAKGLESASSPTSARVGPGT